MPGEGIGNGRGVPMRGAGAAVALTEDVVADRDVVLVFHMRGGVYLRVDCGELAPILVNLVRKSELLQTIACN